MNVLSVPLQFSSSSDSKNVKVKKMLRNELNKDSIRQMSVQHSLDALQKAATLANILGISKFKYFDNFKNTILLFYVLLLIYIRDAQSL